MIIHPRVHAKTPTDSPQHATRAQGASDRAENYHDKGLNDLALVYYDAALQTGERTSLKYMQKAMGCMAAERFLEAERAFTCVLELCPGNPAALLQRGVARFRLERFDGAYADLDAAIAAAPTNPAAWAARARLEARQGAWNNAIADQEHGVALAPRDAELQRDLSLLRAVRSSPCGSASGSRSSLAPQSTSIFAWMRSKLPGGRQYGSVAREDGDAAAEVDALIEPAPCPTDPF